MAGSLQATGMGRIFQTIGADPTKLGYFFILPPLAGMIVQPLIGQYSDRTWTKFGRRMPYLLVAGPLTALVLMLFPNSGSLGFGFGSVEALLFGAVSILLLDVASNAVQQPYKMVISDMVNENQKDLAWSWNQLFSNIGGLLASLLPFILTYLGVANIAPKGEVPESVKISFYIGGIVLLLSSLYTVFSVKEYEPALYAEYHGIDENSYKEKISFWQLLKKAPHNFWTISLVQFFTWFATQYLWTYGTGALAKNIWHVTDPSSAGYQAAGNWFGVLSTIQGVAAIAFSFLVLAHTKPYQRKFVYRLGLLAGAAGFMMIYFIHSQLLSIIPFILLGIAFVITNSVTFSLFTESLNGEHEGAYLGLFNCGICLPQIIASIVSFGLFPLVGKSMPAMLFIGGLAMLLGVFCVNTIQTNFKKEVA